MSASASIATTPTSEITPTTAPVTNERPRKYATRSSSPSLRASAVSSTAEVQAHTATARTPPSIDAGVSQLLHGSPLPGTGEHPLSDDVTVVVGSCGGVVARLSGSVDESDALAALQQSSLRRIDLLVVEPGRAARAAAASVGEQWPVRRRLDAGPALGGSWRVGGVEVVADGSSVTIGLSRAACRLTP